MVGLMVWFGLVAQSWDITKHDKTTQQWEGIEQTGQTGVCLDDNLIFALKLSSKIVFIILTCELLLVRRQ